MEQDPNHTQEHFVYLPNSKTYVRRFVMRGLNHNDAINIGNNIPLGAPVLTANARANDIGGKSGARHNVKPNGILTTEQKILSHTRGWQKRYISTGVSKRPAVSTRGETFMSVHGTAVVDLAMVDPATIFDIHSSKAIANLMGWNSTLVTSAPSARSGGPSIGSEEFLALRDVLRTRELLIEGSVPLDALRCNSIGHCTVGLGCDRFGEPEKLLTSVHQSKWSAKVRSAEPLKYASIHGKYWLFLGFADATTANDFLNPVSGFQGGHSKTMTVNRYAHPPNLGGWK